MQTGHERCIFFSTTSSILKKICQIFIIRESLRVPLPIFWLWPSTSNIYKTFKSPYISTEANKYSSDNIPPRYAFDGTNNGGNFNVQRYNRLPSASSGFHFEHEKINFESSSRDRFSWSDSKLCEDDNFIARTKNKTDSGSMSRPVCERFCHGLGANKTYRSFSFNNPSCITGTIKLSISISSAATDKCFKTQWVIPRGPVLEGVRERTTVVDSKFETLQRSVDNKTSALCYNKNRCLQEGVGCILSRDPSKRGMDIRGKGNVHKYFGTEGSEVSFNVIS